MLFITYIGLKPSKFLWSLQYFISSLVGPSPYVAVSAQGRPSEVFRAKQSSTSASALKSCHTTGNSSSTCSCKICFSITEASIESSGAPLLAEYFCTEIIGQTTTCAWRNNMEKLDHIIIICTFWRTLVGGFEVLSVTVDVFDLRVWTCKPCLHFKSNTSFDKCNTMKWWCSPLQNKTFQQTVMVDLDLWFCFSEF